MLPPQAVHTVASEFQRWTHLRLLLSWRQYWRLRRRRLRMLRGPQRADRAALFVAVEAGEHEHRQARAGLVNLALVGAVGSNPVCLAASLPGTERSTQWSELVLPYYAPI